VEAHQLRHPLGRSGRRRDARAIEIDHHRLEPVAPLAEEQVSDVEIRVPAAGVVERAHGDARRAGGPPARGVRPDATRDAIEASSSWSRQRRGKPPARARPTPG
jgi:hypothetical protein